MVGRRPKRDIDRRSFVAALMTSVVLLAHRVEAMGQSGAFSARRLTTSRQPNAIDRDSGLSKWGWELVRRTSAPANLEPLVVAADSPRLLDEPFVIWCGQDDPGPLTAGERRGLDAFLRLGGILVVDDSRPEEGRFGLAARRELRRILPDSPPVAIESSNVIFRTFYLLRRPIGRMLGPERIDAIVRGRLPQVIFLSCDLLGALATRPDGSFRYDLLAQPEVRREQALRFAVNIAMYVLCSDYKDDQVHAEWLMRRRARWAK
jgi:hypothetical protein